MCAGHTSSRSGLLRAKELRLRAAPGTEAGRASPPPSSPLPTPPSSLLLLCTGQVCVLSEGNLVSKVSLRCSLTIISLQFFEGWGVVPLPLPCPFHPWLQSLEHSVLRVRLLAGFFTKNPLSPPERSLQAEAGGKGSGSQAAGGGLGWLWGAAAEPRTGLGPVRSCGCCFPTALPGLPASRPLAG